MDVLAANDQENRVRALQAGAAGAKGFGAKTPANKAPKTPFKVPLNDENAIQRGGKSVMKTNGKGNENMSMTIKKGGKLDTNAFVTPAGPRTRAPLGMKTTNAKATAFQTPAPLSASAKTQKLSPRLRRPKVKVHQPEAVTDEDDVPEVEYMPPKEVPLPDNLDEDMPPINWDFPMFKGPNTRGLYSAANHNPVGADGRTRAEREWDEDEARDKKKSKEEAERLFSEAMAKEDAETRRYLGVDQPKAPASKSAAPTRKGPSTLKARSAAAALSPVSKRSHAPAAPATSAAKSRLPSSILPSRRPAQPTIDPSATRNAKAAAASKSTIGYARGRTAAPTARMPLSNVTRPPSSSTVSRRPTTASSTASQRIPSTNTTTSKPRGPFSRCSSTSTNATLVTPPEPEEPYRTAEDDERETALLLLADDDNDDEIAAWEQSFRNQLQGQDAVDEELEDFQLQLPEGF